MSASCGHPALPPLPEADDDDLLLAVVGGVHGAGERELDELDELGQGVLVLAEGEVDDGVAAVRGLGDAGQVDRCL